MLEVNAITFILLVEGFGILLFVLLIVFLVGIFRVRNKKRDVGQLATRVRDGAETRLQATESFLQAVFHLEGDDLRAAIETIDRQETEFYQQLIDTLYRGSGSKITNLDAALVKLIGAYKCLQPRVMDAPEADPVARQLEATLAENERLREELSITKSTMSDMVAEFGEMFGGGRDHELSADEVLARVSASKPDFEIEAEAEDQK